MSARGQAVEKTEGWTAAHGAAYKKLNLACGTHQLEGFLNIDSNPAVKPDVVSDLERFPWSGLDWSPASDTYAEVNLSHFLEHVSEPYYLRFLEELYRVCLDGAIVRVSVPYYSHMDAFADPTHRRMFCERSFLYFSAAARKHLIGVDHYAWPFDFEAERVQYVYEDAYQSLSNEAREYAKNHDWNVVKQMTVFLRAYKPIRA